MTETHLPFGRFAADYDANRPSYPIAAVNWLLEGTSGLVVDLGAGSGKLAELLVDRCASILAVEPDPEMLAQLKLRLPGVAAERGSAEKISIPRNSAGVVLAAQAWHWFDSTLALREAERVLVPRGRLGVLWNAPSSRSIWQRRLGAEVPAVSPVDEQWWPTGIPREGTESKLFYWTQEMRPSELALEYATHLAVRNAIEDRRDRYIAHVLRLAKSEADRLESECVPYERLTWCARRETTPTAN